MSINLKLILGCMLFAVLTVALAMTSQRAHDGLHWSIEQDLAPRQEAMVSLQDAQRRATLTEAHFTIVSALAGRDVALDAGDRSFLADAVNDMLARVQVSSTVGASEATRSATDLALNALIRLKAAGGDMTRRLLSRELGMLTSNLDDAIGGFGTDIVRQQDGLLASLDATGRNDLVFFGCALVGVLAVSLFLSRSLVHRVRQATAMVGAMSRGDFSTLRTTDSTVEFSAFFAALEELRTVTVQHSQSQERILLSQASSFGTTLEMHQNQFGAALNNMTQGLCMLDANLKLIVFNEPFSKLFSNFKLGAPAHEVLADPRFHKLLAPHETGMFVHEMPSGQLLQVKRRGVCGGGLVITFDDVTEQHRTSQRLEHLAGHDALTGLLNRRRFRDDLQEMLASRAKPNEFAVVYLDLRGFKSINDSFGHPVGDALLKAVSTRLSQCAGAKDRLARLGGDEFAIIQSAETQPAAANALVEEILRAFEIPFDVEGCAVTIGVKLGVTVARQEGNGSPITADTVMQNCDLALHDAKAQETSACRFYSPRLRDALAKQRALEADLREALEKGQFELAFQPFVDASKKAVSGFEALLRWRHPVKGLIPPGDFIPTAEGIGLITEIGLWVLRAACAEAARWPAGLSVSVNLSPVQFKSKTLVSDIDAALRDAGLSPKRLQLEVTESLFLDHADDVLATLTALRRLGTRISMDDFGTGYSSLGYLTRFPFDKIKIDQSFVRDIHKPESLAVIRAVIGLSQSMKIAVIAEGIETAEQYQLLHQEGCREMQGYLFSQPRPATDLPRLVMKIPVEWDDLTRGASLATPRRMSGT